jgi:hypothetical protein
MTTLAIGKQGAVASLATGMAPVAASVAASTSKAAPDTLVAIRNINRADPSRLGSGQMARVRSE